MRTRPLILTLALTPLLLTACTTRDYRDFPLSDNASVRVHDAIVEQSRHIAEPDNFETEDERLARLRYVGQLIKMVNEYEQKRAELYTERLTAKEAEQLDMALVALTRVFETLANYPGRLGEDGEPLDSVTAELLDDLPELPEG